MQEAEKYNLTEEEYQKSLTMAEMAVFMRGKSVENPKSIFIIAQAGARKNRVKRICN